MNTNNDIAIFILHGEILEKFSSLKDRVFELGELEVDTTKLLVSLNIFAEIMVQMTKSESDKHGRKAIVEEVLNDLKKKKDDDERKKT